MDEIIKELHSLKLSGMARLWASLNETKRLDKLTLVDVCIPADPRSPIPVISVHSVDNLQYLWQS